MKLTSAFFLFLSCASLCANTQAPSTSLAHEAPTSQDLPRKEKPPFLSSPQGSSTGVNLLTQVDFLYWRSMNLGFVPANQTVQAPEPFSPKTLVKMERFKAQWKPGFRASLGLNLDHDNWDLRAVWTYYYNKNIKDRQMDVNIATPDPIDPSLLYNNDEGFFGYWAPAALQIALEKFLNYQSIWRFNFNAIDLELGKFYSLVKGFSFYPKISFRAAWLRQHFSSKFFLTVAGPQLFSPNLAFPKIMEASNQFWGIGPRFGFQSDWEVLPNWSLLGSFYGSLLYGTTDVLNKTDRLHPGDNITGDTQCNDSFQQLAPNLEISLGIGWKQLLNKDKMCIQLSLSWESQIWWNQFHLIAFDQPTLDTTSSKLIGNPLALNQPLFMDGITANLRFDF